MKMHVCALESRRIRMQREQSSQEHATVLTSFPKSLHCLITQYSSTLVHFYHHHLTDFLTDGPPHTTITIITIIMHIASSFPSIFILSISPLPLTLRKL